MRAPEFARVTGKSLWTTSGLGSVQPMFRQGHRYEAGGATERASQRQSASHVESFLCQSVVNDCNSDRSQTANCPSFMQHRPLPLTSPFSDITPMGSSSDEPVSAEIIAVAAATNATFCPRGWLQQLATSPSPHQDGTDRSMSVATWDDTGSTTNNNS
jgi:hypothetical protein